LYEFLKSFFLLDYPLDELSDKIGEISQKIRTPEGKILPSKNFFFFFLPLNFFFPHLVYLMCRRGNDSQKAVLVLQASILKLAPEQENLKIEIKNIRGGINSWANEIDSNFPVY
jgi:rhodanese-related sulfurtransferase